MTSLNRGESTAVPPGTCLIHGSYAGSRCPMCSTAGGDFAGLPYEQQPMTPGVQPSQREWQCCPVCQGSGRLWDPIMGMGHPGATMWCHLCAGTGTIERPR